MTTVASLAAACTVAAVQGPPVHGVPHQRAGPGTRRGLGPFPDDVDGGARDQAVPAPALKPALLHALTDRCLHRGSQERQAGLYPLSGGVGSAVTLVHAAAQRAADGEDLTVVLVDVERLAV